MRNLWHYKNSKQKKMSTLFPRLSCKYPSLGTNETGSYQTFVNENSTL